MRPDLSEFRSKSQAKAIVIFAVTFLSFAALWAASFALSGISLWYVLFFALPLHVLHARLFVILHDCGHHAFSRTKWLNNGIGHLIGLFYCLPFLAWRHLHNRHHRYQGNLDERGKSLDVWLLTKREYEASSLLTRARYRLYRSPFVFLGLAPFVFFLGIFRLPFEKFDDATRLNIYGLDLFIVLAGFAAHKYGVLDRAVLVQFSFMSLSFVLASWLFYAQHQIEQAIWFRRDEFDQTRVAIEGSTFYRLPRFFQWMTGDISYHHIHHLDPQIPMYNLARAHRSLEDGLPIATLDLRESAKLFQFNLWDEDQKKMVPF